MIAVFGLEPQSIILAYMLTRLRDAKAVQFDPTKRFFFDEVEDTRQLDFNKIYPEYGERFGRIDFLEDSKLYEVISNEIFWALRFKSRDNDVLILQVLNQIEAEGSKSYLSKNTGESREMRFRVRRVLSEFNRALRFITFTRYETPALSISKASFDNDIADMVLRAEAMRAPGYVVAIYDDKCVKILLDDEPYIAKRRRVPLSPDRREFQRFWGDLPSSGKVILVRDETHAISEAPSIVFPQMDETAERAISPEVATLDDFV